MRTGNPWFDQTWRPDPIELVNTSLPAVSWFRRYPAAQFLVALALALVSSPFTEELQNGDLIEALRLTIVLIAGLLAVGGRRRLLVLGIALVTPALIGKWVNHWQPTLVTAWMFLLPAVLFLLLLVGQLLRFILRASYVNSEVLCAAVAGFLLLGLLFALAYILVGQLSPGAYAFSAGAHTAQRMKGFTAVYFSFITLCTVGYGDIFPASGPARMLAMMESVIGTFYMAVLIARLVSIHASTRGINQPESKDGS